MCVRVCQYMCVCACVCVGVCVDEFILVTALCLTLDILVKLVIYTIRSILELEN